jgi:hypothetical protein
MDKGLVVEQFKISRRRVQQIVKGYRDSAEIPQPQTAGRKPYEEYPDNLEQRILELAHIFRVKNDISIDNSCIHAILEESKYVNENPNKQGWRRPWI